MHISLERQANALLLDPSKQENCFGYTPLWHTVLILLFTGTEFGDPDFPLSGTGRNPLTRSFPRCHEVSVGWGRGRLGTVGYTLITLDFGSEIFRLSMLTAVRLPGFTGSLRSPASGWQLRVRLQAALKSTRAHRVSRSWARCAGCQRRRHASGTCQWSSCPLRVRLCSPLALSAGYPQTGTRRTRWL
eukprot:1468271-Rhodomonas_salina.2